jgi:hypothetical protein
MFATAVVGYGPFASATYVIRSGAVKEFRGCPAKHSGSRLVCFVPLPSDTVNQRKDRQT